MSGILKRVFIYFFMPFALAVFFLPVSKTRNETVKRNCIVLRVNDIKTSDSDTSMLKKINPVNAPAQLNDQLAMKHKLMVLWGAQGLPEFILEDVSMTAWTQFLQAEKLDVYETNFIYEDMVVSARTELKNRTESVEIAGLDKGLKFIAFLVLPAVGVLLFNLYNYKGEGIQVGKTGAIIAWDVVIITVGAVFVWWLLEFGLVTIFDVNSEWDEDFGRGMGVFWVVFVIPLMALITTATSAQIVKIDSFGISVSGVFGNRSVAWVGMVEIELGEIVAPRSGGGVASVRSVSRPLRIIGTDKTVTIMEPPLKATKIEIIEAMLTNAPELFKNKVIELRENW